MANLSLELLTTGQGFSPIQVKGFKDMMSWYAVKMTSGLLVRRGCRSLQQCIRAFSGAAGRRRVVVTGMGLVTPLGCGVPYVWNRIINGQSGITKLTDESYAAMPSHIAGVVPRGSIEGQFNPADWIPKGRSNEFSPATLYAFAAASEALIQAGLTDMSESDKLRAGVALGMSILELDHAVETGLTFQEKGYKKVSPHFITRILLNMAAGQISLKYGFQGPNHAVSTACATGLHSVGDASRFIKYGDADVMVCGATDACVTPLIMASFSRIRALTTKYEDSPEQASRPFDSARCGFVMAEGAGVIVLEELEHARARGAEIHGEILGYGLSSDSNHVTAPAEDGDGAYRSMYAAIADAGVDPSDLQHVNAHATSTPRGDMAESIAISRLLGAHAPSVAVCSTKGATGHLMGAAGTVESIFTLLACKHSTVPPTLNLENPDTDKNLNYIVDKSHHLQSDGNRNVGLCNSFGFGGTNASLCVASVS